MRIALRSFGIVAIACCAASVEAAITYVDAISNTTGTDGNTTINGALVATGVNTGGNSGTDGLWRDRVLTGANNDTIWETDTTRPQAETTEPLITTIALPAPGTYKLYAFYISQVNDGPTGGTSWDLAAGVSTDGNPPTLTTYIEGDASSIYTTEDGSEFSSAVLTRYSSSEMWMANLGTFTLSAQQAAAVSFYIDGPDRDTSQAPGNTNGDINYGQRTWYEGVGYELVPTLVPGDFDGDGDVDGADFVVWQTNFPTSPNPAVAPVPEPAAGILILAGLGTVSLGWLRRRRGR